jgi:hypothetical protein
LETFQLSLVDYPAAMAADDAVKLLIVGAGAVLTVTVVVAVADPAELIAVSL